jgi:aminopeptidase N
MKCHTSSRMTVKAILTLIYIFSFQSTNAQLLSKSKSYTHADTLRGALSEWRSCFDVLSYDLHVAMDIHKRYITGSNKIEFVNITDIKKIQIDLFEQYKINLNDITANDKPLKFYRDGNAIFIEAGDILKSKKGEVNSIEIKYEGNVTVAKRAPWDGGFVFAKDSNNNDWISVACEGFGASSWWPCKDHLSDEPMSMKMSYTVPDTMIAVGNGRLIEIQKTGSLTKFTWQVLNPINTYSVNLSIGDYIHIHDSYYSKEKKKDLDLDYWVLRNNKEKAIKQFSQVKKMLIPFEKYFGPYPFYEDGYKLIETPFLGMEHQSGIAYGNKYLNGYAGNMKFTFNIPFDYIIIHESGHEWYGNNISCADIGDMWIHESFTTYSEAVFVEHYYGRKTAEGYINSMKKGVRNEAPTQGPYGVNEEGDGDMYSKGSLMLNTFRNIVNDDKIWWGLIKKMNTEDFRNKTISYTDMLKFFNQNTSVKWDRIFEQYIQKSNIPELKYSVKSNGNIHTISAQWKADVPNFEMPIVIKRSKNKYENVLINSSNPTEIIFKGKLKNMMIDEDKIYFKK